MKTFSKFPILTSQCSIPKNKPTRNITSYQRKKPAHHRQSRFFFFFELQSYFRSQFRQQVRQTYRQIGDRVQLRSSFRLGDYSSDKLRINPTNITYPDLWLNQPNLRTAMSISPAFHESLPCAYTLPNNAPPFLLIRWE